MTWYYEQANGELVIYEADPTTTAEIDRLVNDGSGFDIPGDVLEVMRDTLVAEANVGGGSPVVTTRAIFILLDMASEDIERGVPPGL